MGMSCLQLENQAGLDPRERAICKLFPGDTIMRNCWRPRNTAKGEPGGWRMRELPNTSYWTAENVAKAFKTTPEKVREIKKKQAPAQYRWWNEKLVVQYLEAFIEREGRWPNKDDFKQCVKNKIPSMNSIRRACVSQERSVWDHKLGRSIRHVDNVPEAFRWGYPRAQYIITQKRTCKHNIILTTPNITVRREAINKMGFDKLIKKKLAVEISRDEFGILWQLPLDGDEDMCFVEVVNSTPEKDGTFAHYFLRVPPDTLTPQQGVAWSFGVPSNEEWENFKIEVAT